MQANQSLYLGLYYAGNEKRLADGIAGAKGAEKDSLFPLLAGSVIGGGHDRHDKRVPGCNLNAA